MSKKASLTDVSTGYNSWFTINENFKAINQQFENTLSLDGSGPNALQADLDLNGNDLLNIKSLDSSELTINGTRVLSFNAVPSWEGTWLPNTSYGKDNIVSSDGSTYISLEAHTSSGTFSTDLTDNKWELFVAKGAPGDGTGDMLGANNLSDVTDVATARANLGLGTAATTSSSIYATAEQGNKADTAIQPSDKASVTEAQNGINDSKFMTPKKTRDSYWRLRDEGQLGYGQSWQSPSRSGNTTYQNNTGRPIQVYIYGGRGNASVSTNNSDWVAVGEHETYFRTANFIVPPGHYYRTSGSFSVWSELR